METAIDSLSQDETWKRAVEEFGKPKELAYARVDSRLLRAFAKMPGIEIPKHDENRQDRLFELRVYEARTLKASLAKIRMFEEGEIAIFRKVGLLPVFFGQTLIGPGMPSLAYMLAFDSVESREENWRRFVSDPDWIKLRSKPGFSDAEIVSNIHNCFLRPTKYSPIR